MNPMYTSSQVKSPEESKYPWDYYAPGPHHPRRTRPSGRWPRVAARWSRPEGAGQAGGLRPARHGPSGVCPSTGSSADRPSRLGCAACHPRTLLEDQDPRGDEPRRVGIACATAAAAAACTRCGTRIPSELAFTNVACRLLDTEHLPLPRLRATAAAGAGLRQADPGQRLKKIDWLPPTCAYRLVAEGRTWTGGTRWSRATPTPCTRPASRCAAAR